MCGLIKGSGGVSCCCEFVCGWTASRLLFSSCRGETRSDLIDEQEEDERGTREGNEPMSVAPRAVPFLQNPFKSSNPIDNG